MGVTSTVFITMSRILMIGYRAGTLPGAGRTLVGKGNDAGARRGLTRILKLCIVKV